MQLHEYPRPPTDTGWGFHDSAGADRRPADVAGYAHYLRQELGVTWFKVLALGGNKVDLVRTFTQAGIECIVRIYAGQPHPHYVVPENEVRAYVGAGAHYFEWGNEPNLSMEWNRASWDEGARVDKVCQQFLRNAEVIKRAGGIPLFPALSPGGDYPHRDWYRTTFEWLRQHGKLSALDGAAIAIHNRPLNHPLSYRDDSGCFFLEYEWIDDLVRQYLGHSLPLLGTEAGYEPGWDQDRRYPMIDPQRHAQYNVEILRGFQPPSVPPVPPRSAALSEMPRGGLGGMRWRDSLFCQCMWLVDGFGHRDFSEAAWHNNRQWAGGGNLPAVAALKAEWKARPFTRRFDREDEQMPAPTPTVDHPGAVWKPSPNYGYPRGLAGRGGRKPIAIVFHISGGSLAATDATVTDPAEECSYHYAVGPNGEVHQYVREADAAWHAGGVNKPEWLFLEPGVNPNLTTIGIAWAAKPGEAMTEAAYQSLVAVARGAMRRWGIPAGPENQIGHCQIDRVNRADCPGPAFPWGRLREDLEGIDEEAIREAAWNAGGIPYNPDAAFPRYAREHGLGNPETPEFDIVVNGVTYRGQGFRDAIVYAPLGHWDNIEEMDW